MAMMGQPLPLTRTDYLDRDPYEPVKREESGSDINYYHRRLESMHNTGMHSWGIASGLRVTATIGGKSLKVEPGIAIQGGRFREQGELAAGEHISLAMDGYVTIGNESKGKRIETNFVELSTSAITGEKYLAIQHHEFFDEDTCKERGECDIRHSPRLSFLDAKDFVDDGTWLVLAKVDVDSQGIVTGLTAALRRQLDLPTGSIHLWRSHTIKDNIVPNTYNTENTLAGEVTARQEGGINLTVANTTDELHLAAQTGNMARLTLAAEKIVALNQAGQETISLTTEAGAIAASTLTTSGKAEAGSFSTTGHASVGTLNATGKVGAGSFATAGAAAVGTLMASGKVGAGEFSTLGHANVGSLTVTGDSNLQTATIQSNLHCTGLVEMIGRFSFVSPGTYRAKTDGYLTGIVRNGLIKGSTMVQGTTAKYEVFADNNLSNVYGKSFLMPVRKGDEWSANLVGIPSGYNFYWTPLGSDDPAETFEKISDQKLEDAVLPSEIQQQQNETRQQVAALVDTLEHMIQNPGQKSEREQFLLTLQKLFHIPDDDVIGDAKEVKKTPGKPRKPSSTTE